VAAPNSQQANPLTSHMVRQTSRGSQQLPSGRKCPAGSGCSHQYPTAGCSSYTQAACSTRISHGSLGTSRGSVAWLPLSL
jgi:hypothetical protein